MKPSVKDYLVNVNNSLRIYSHLLKKTLTEIFHFLCSVSGCPLVLVKIHRYISLVILSKFKGIDYIPPEIAY